MASYSQHLLQPFLPSFPPQYAEIFPAEQLMVVGVDAESATLTWTVSLHHMLCMKACIIQFSGSFENVGSAVWFPSGSYNTKLQSSLVPYTFAKYVSSMVECTKLKFTQPVLRS